MFVFFICFLVCFFILRSDLKQKEKIYLNLQYSRNYLNSQLEILSKHSDDLRKIKILKQKFFLNIFHEDFLKNSMDKKRFEYTYSLPYEKIKNLEKNLNVKELDYRSRIGREISHLLRYISTNYFIQPKNIKILAIRKIFFPNTYKIDFSIYCFLSNCFNFLNQVVKLKNFIIIQNFNLKYLKNVTQHCKQNIIFSLIVTMPYETNLKNIKFISKQTIATKYPLSKIKFYGFLSDNVDHTLGLIGFPNRKICKITLGNYLGIDRGLVIGIFPEKIIIKENKSNELVSLSNQLRKIAYDKELY